MRLTRSTRKVLEVLAAGRPDDELTASELELQVTSGTLTAGELQLQVHVGLYRALDRLVEEGWVFREFNPNYTVVNGKRTWMRYGLTDAGRAGLAELVKAEAAPRVSRPVRVLAFLRFAKST